MPALLSARPHAFPISGDFSTANTALMVVDMQIDFCGEDGLMAARGADIAAMRRPIPAIGRVLAAARAAGMPVIHTREGHAPDLSDLPATKASWDMGAAVGQTGPSGRYLVRGEPCWNIVPELAPRDGETVIDKTGYGAFYGTDLERHLATAGIASLVITGVTTDCCVTSTLRGAVDRGFDCLVLEDCCASASPAAHAATITILERGVFGSVSDAETFLGALEARAETPRDKGPGFERTSRA